jgi:hypothetical protein
LPLSSAPAQAVVLWECFEFEDSDVKTGLFDRTYHELDPDAVTTAEISFDGTNFTACTEGSGGVVNIPLGWQGTSFIIRITNISPDVVRIGSWAVVY